MEVRVKNLDSIAEEMLLGTSEARAMSKYVLDSVTQQIHKEWQDQAKNNLRRTRQGYINGLQIIESGRLQNTIVLKGSLNNMIEDGAAPFDMKKGFANSNKKKFNSRGEWYLTIPMRYSVPNTVSENPAFTGILPTDVYKAIVKKSKDSNQPLKRKDLPQQFQRIRRNKTTGYIHKSAIFEGLKRTSKKYNTATQSKYNTFRRVSANSDPSSWIHSGFPRLDLARRAVQSADIENESENAIDRFLKS